MSSLVIPPPLEGLRNQPFSFYPAILNIEHNQWQYRQATWSEVLVVNARTGLEVWIPRRFLGGISHAGEPAVVAGLLKELEYKDGAVWPCRRRVIQMPVAAGTPAPPGHSGPAPVVGIRLESRSESHVFRLVGGALVLGIVAAYVVVNFYRESALRPHIGYAARNKPYLELTAQDTYDTVVRKLGAPAGDRWQDAGGVRYRALWYPDCACTVILRDSGGRATYIGTLDVNGSPVH